MKTEDYDNIVAAIAAYRGSDCNAYLVNTFPHIEAALLHSVCAQEVQKRVKRSYHHYAQRSKMKRIYQKYLAEVARKSPPGILLEMARNYNFSPAMLAKLLLEYYLTLLDEEERLALEAGAAAAACSEGYQGTGRDGAMPSPPPADYPVSDVRRAGDGGARNRRRRNRRPDTAASALKGHGTVTGDGAVPGSGAPGAVGSVDLTHSRMSPVSEGCENDDPDSESLLKTPCSAGAPSRGSTMNDTCHSAGNDSILHNTSATEFNNSRNNNSRNINNSRNNNNNNYNNSSRRPLASSLPRGGKHRLNKLFRDTSLIPDRVLSLEVHMCLISDEVYGPFADTIKHSIGHEYEVLLCRKLEERGIGYKTEDDLRKMGCDKTPDIRLDVPIGVGGRVVNWIESKASFGDRDSHRGYLKDQFWSYWNRFGPGLVIYWFGFIDELDSLADEGILLRESFPTDIVVLDPLLVRE